MRNIIALLIAAFAALTVSQSAVSAADRYDQSPSYWLSISAEIESEMLFWYEVSSSRIEAEQKAEAECQAFIISVMRQRGTCQILSLPLHSLNHWEEWDVTLLRCPSLGKHKVLVARRISAEEKFVVAADRLYLTEKNPEAECIAIDPEIGRQSLGDWLSGKPIRGGDG